MRSVKEIAGGILIALVSVGLILGSLSLAFSENSLIVEPSPTSPSSPTVDLPSPTNPIPTLPPVTQDSTATLIAISPTYASAQPQAMTNTPWPTAKNCSPRADWPLIYNVQPGDTLYRISGLYRVSVADIQRANCLTNSTIYPNQKLRVPNVPTSTFTASPTGPASATPTSTFTATATAIPSNTPLPTNTPTPTSFPRTATPTPTP